jgi:diaminohydroxyphosphoribosylaminopyrimidine deaminase/5-amino-6-(5-phosphoribosylamino)uracil reductase
MDGDDWRLTPELDRYWMQLCLRLAQQAQGYTTPNPMVGSVVVGENRLVGSGYHFQPGQPHAEVLALRAAGEAAKGATLYVNLEPCNHYGRTPPCTEAILAAGIQRVVAGMVDPNPLVAGQGIERLRAAGLDVVVGVESAACHRLNEAFCFSILHNRSYGILKYAMTLDGKIATHTGHSQWISSSASRRRLHQLRARVDAIIVGGNTVRRDNPRLTVRSETDQPLERQPLRVVLSHTLDLPAAAHLWDQSVASTLVLTTEEHFPAGLEQLQQQQVEVMILPDLDPCAVAAYLYQRGYLTVLWECGGRLAAAALAAGAIQKVMAYVSPQIVGGSNAPTPIEGEGVDHLSQAWQLQDVEAIAIGSDQLIVGYLRSG